MLKSIFRKGSHLALVASLVPLGAVGVPTAKADPPVALPPDFPTDQLFCFRITDLERIPGDAEGNAFRVQLQVLNWTNHQADALIMSVNEGTTGGVRIANASIDINGRGGPIGGNEIGSGAFDGTAIHSGRGQGDLPGLTNDWQVGTVSTTHVQWDNANNGTPIPNRDLLFTIEGSSSFLVPGFGTDGLGDSAVDGGPTPYTNQGPGGGQPSPDGSGNVLDGFVLDIDNWDEGEVFSLNWFLAASFEGSGALQTASILPPGQFFPIGTSAFGNDFGFGIINLVRIGDSIGTPAPNLPGPVFEGNTGFVQNGTTFYDTVYEIPNPAEFAAELGAAITGRFLNNSDNVFGAQVNTNLVPEPTNVVILGAGLAALGLSRRKQS
ncbi:MAG: PEP-CTERM sorting domain-containing protein [Planctomycetota bacterium]|nr:PEP-CTERM sorting domain-containing protein [Planctomycetota bacterium]MDA1180701.1 PEP-CTERM sorting domain-containing protein [Planctomycetota bacterium]